MKNDEVPHHGMSRFPEEAHMGENRSQADSGERDGRELIPSRLPAGLKEYTKFYRQSIESRVEFWRIQAGRLVWEKEFGEVVRENFAEGTVSWFSGGSLNACRTILDRRIEQGEGDAPALLAADDDGGFRSMTCRELDEEAGRFAAALEASGIGRGDRFMLYLPDSPATVACMLGCARLGVVIVPVPVRYTAELVGEIAADCGASGILVAPRDDSPFYASRALTVMAAFPGKTVVNAGAKEVPGAIFLGSFLSRGGAVPGCVAIESEDPFLILYANSAAGVPRGSVFAAGGFLVQAAVTFDYLFSSPVGGGKTRSMVCELELASAAGQSCGVWGPLLNGTCVVIAAGGKRSPAERMRDVLDRCDSPVLLTTPVFLSELKKEIDDSQRAPEKRFALVASTGDVLKPRHIGFAAQTLTSGPEKVLNLWVQTECGAAVIGTFPGAELNRPGALGLPFPGIEPVVVNNLGQACKPNESGQLGFRGSWPSMIRTIWSQDERYRQLYFRRVHGMYSTNDGARIDADGFVWFMGRLDDVIKVRGQSLATSEIEAVLVAHPQVTEAAVVSVEEENGETLVAFLVLDRSMGGADQSALHDLEAELTRSIERRVGEFTLISRFIVAQEFPRTRTGKVVRRMLKRIAVGDIGGDEDMSHLANPDAVSELIRKRGL
jgi:acetyl-CoA synthetase